MERINLLLSPYNQGKNNLLRKPHGTMKRTSWHGANPNIYEGTGSENVLPLGRAQLRTAVGLTTGHYQLRKHLRHGGREPNPEGRLSGRKSKTPLHLIFDCGALQGHRYHVFGAHILEQRDIAKMAISMILE